MIKSYVPISCKKNSNTNYYRQQYQFIKVWMNLFQISNPTIIDFKWVYFRFSGFFFHFMRRLALTVVTWKGTCTEWIRILITTTLFMSLTNNWYNKKNTRINWSPVLRHKHVLPCLCRSVRVLCTWWMGDRECAREICITSHPSMGVQQEAIYQVFHHG